MSNASNEHMAKGTNQYILHIINDNAVFSMVWKWLSKRTIIFIYLDLDINFVIVSVLTASL